MSILIELLTKYWYVVAIVALGAYAQHESHRADLAHDALVAFKSSVEAVGEQAIKRNERINDANKKRLASAVADRRVALACLQDDNCSGRGGVPRVSETSFGSGTICFSATAFNAAFQQFGNQLDQFVQDAGRLVASCEGAQVDAKTLLKAWPSDASN